MLSVGVTFSGLVMKNAAAAIDPSAAVNMGMETMMKQMSDPNTLKQTMEMMQDPGR